jgi:hypothetical protein
MGAGSSQLRRLRREPPIGNGLEARLDFCNAVTLFMPIAYLGNRYNCVTNNPTLLNIFNEFSQEALVYRGFISVVEGKIVQFQNIFILSSSLNRLGFAVFLGFFPSQLDQVDQRFDGDFMPTGQP